MPQILIEKWESRVRQPPQEGSPADIITCISYISFNERHKNACALLKKQEANEIGLYLAHFHLAHCPLLLRDLMGWMDQGPLAKSEKALEQSTRFPCLSCKGFKKAKA